MRTKPFTLLIALLFVLLFAQACTPAASQDDIDATVNARVEQTMIAAVPTATSTAESTATPEATATSTITPTGTAKPTATSRPTSTATITPEPTTDWQTIIDDPESHFDRRVDDFTGKIGYYPYEFRDAILANQSILVVDVNVNADNPSAPSLTWFAYYTADDWIFLDTIEIKVGDTIYDLSDRFIRAEVLTEVNDDASITEAIIFPFVFEDVRIIEGLTPGDAVRFSGSDGSDTFLIGRDVIESMQAALALFQSLGGDLASQTYRGG